jgi:hypothetical protein
VALRLTSVALELRLNPIYGCAIAICPLEAIAKLRQSFNRGLISFQVELTDDLGDGIVGWDGFARPEWRLLIAERYCTGEPNAGHWKHERAHAPTFCFAMSEASTLRQSMTCVASPHVSNAECEGQDPR